MNEISLADRVSRLRPTAVNRVLQKVRQARGRRALAGLADARAARYADADAHRRGGDAIAARRPHRLSRQPRRARAAPGRRREAPARAGARRTIPTARSSSPTGPRWALYAALGALVELEGTVLLPDPIYDAYAAPIALWGGRPAPVAPEVRDGRFTIDARSSKRAGSPAATSSCSTRPGTRSAPC